MTPGWVHDGSNVVLVEIKSGNNIEQRHVEQVRRCDRVDIRTAEEALDAAQVRERTTYEGEVRAVETAIVYHDLDEAYVQQASDASDTFQSRLEELTAHAVVLTQDYGGFLRVLAGEFDEAGTVQSLLRDGVELVENPPDQIMLTENMEHEILATAVADIWGEQALDHDDGVRVTRTEARDHFAPRHNVPLDRLDLVFQFLTEFGACERVDDHTYEFGREHAGRVLAVESRLTSETVEEYLLGSDQTSFDDYC